MPVLVAPPGQFPDCRAARGAHMTLLEKSLLPGVVFAGYVARPSRRSRRILRPSRKNAGGDRDRQEQACVCTHGDHPACRMPAPAAERR